jgi:hypothetical protein
MSDIKEIGLTIDELEKHAKKCLENDEPLTVLIEMPGFEAPEAITNPPENIEKKIEYYKATYDENCNHKYAKGIRIVSVAE